MEVRSVQRNLNPEAPAFFPARNALSAPNYLAISSSVVNIPDFPQYQTLLSPSSRAFSAPWYFFPSYYSYGHQNPGHYPNDLMADKAAFTPVEPVSSSPGSLMAKMELEEAAQEAKVMVGLNGNMGGCRRRNRDHNKQYLRYKRYGKEGFIRADHSKSHKRKWRVKAPDSICGQEDRDFGTNAEASFEFDEYPRSVQGWGSKNKNRERHKQIPLKNDGNETTVMIRNIPNRYTREKLKDILDQHCKLTNQEAQDQNADAGEEEAPLSAFDFLYIPIDFVTKLNKGYAFVNFTHPGAVRKLFDAWHGKHWDYFQSNKIREICCAKLQGVEQLQKNLERMEFPSEDFQPLMFSPARDGSDQQMVEETTVGRCRGSRSPHQTKPKQADE